MECAWIMTPPCMLLSPGEAYLQNVKLSTWKHVHEKRNVVYILPRPVVGVSSSEKKHTVRGELADPVWEKKGKCAKNTTINMKCSPAKHCFLRF